MGSEPKTTPLQLSAAIALSACKNEAKIIIQIAIFFLTEMENK
jgi:hypothetical protein